MRDHLAAQTVGAAILSVLAAAASTACCWLPLLALGGGLTGVGLAASLERFHSLLVIAAILFLSVGFWLSYGPPATRCAPDGSCPGPSKRVRRLHRALLWTSLPLVFVFALFPQCTRWLASARTTLGIGTSPLDRHQASTPALAGPWSGHLDSTLVQVLNPGSPAARDAFNAAADDVRFVLLLSPT